MNPNKLSYDLRKGHTPDLDRRRWIVGLSFLGAAMGQIVSLFQMGMIKRLPDVPVGPYNSEKADSSASAYRWLETPDAPMMVANYAVTAALAAAGGKYRAQDKPWIPLLMGAKILGDISVTLKLARDEWEETRALCSYCQVATLASIVSLALALPEMWRAVGGRGGER